MESKIILTFENPSSVKTALLLDQVLVHEQPIKVQAYEPPKPQAPAEPAKEPVKIPLFPEAPLYSLNTPQSHPSSPSQPKYPQPPTQQPRHYVMPPGYPPQHPQYVLPPGHPSQHPQYVMPPGYPPAYQPTGYPGSYVYPQGPPMSPAGYPNQSPNASQLRESQIYPVSPAGLPPGGTHALPLELINSSIYVTGLSATLPNTELISFFTFCGAVRGFSRPEDSQEGLVQFNRPDSVGIAKQMTGAHLKGSKIKVNSLSCYGDDPHTKAVVQLLSNFTTQLPS